MANEHGGASQANLPATAARRTVRIDPGHGGADPGAVGNGVVEAEVVLEVSKLAAAAIRNSGLHVTLTRSADVSLPPAARVRSIRSPALCVVSIHANSAATPSARGHEVWVSAFDRGSQELGMSISRRLVESIPLPAREPPVRTRLRTGGMGDWYYVIDEPRKAGIPSVLLECGFVSNPEDAAYLAGFWGRFQLAHAVGHGVLDWAGIGPDCIAERG